MKKYEKNTRYRIDGTEFTAAVCKNCENCVDTSQVQTYRLPGMQAKGAEAEGVNWLFILDVVSVCCEHPDYNYYGDDYVFDESH